MFFLMRRKGSTEMVQLLLKKCADVNLVAHHRMAPLHIAAWHGKKEVIELLVKSGGFKEYADIQGLTQKRGVFAHSQRNRK